MFPFVLLPLIIFLSSVIAHEHQANRRLPSPTWHHSLDHSLSYLFRREDPDDDGVEYPDVGSPEWTSKYPNGPPNPTQMPSAWMNRLKAAVAAGKIPAIPVSSGPANTNPTYPPGHDPTSHEICSATYKCRIDGDIWDSPSNIFGLGFDDGPLPPSGKLYDFLMQNNEVATNFVIGLNIRQNPDMFLRAYREGHDLAVHTYTHPHMTTQTNEQVVAELGWSMQIIHDSAGGRVPKYWRPPYGDTDLRVSAIAREVFGLTCIIWNHDTEDWSLTSNGTTLQAIQNSMTQWLTGPKEPGLIILEHELSDQSVQAFLNAYPLIKSNGWTIKSVVQTANDTNPSPYHNAPNTLDGPVPVEDILPPQPQSKTSTSSTVSSTTSTDSHSSVLTASTITSSSPHASTTAAHANSAFSIGTHLIAAATWSSTGVVLTYFLLSCF
ncbi:hypothetical protein D9758_001046 [Tetrapyrgos nigripes]|uniref:chitin deacetylase n=1 Tax=Tetrapyrgos nigripes TaxID=182062 RepID=A0A8H5GRX8_9AGAR|nr:hypothetical protein D9758_001046 [Tetrapyrgos nigripes]